MNKEIFRKINQSLGKKLDDMGSFVKFNDYKPVKISVKNFHDIKDELSPARIAFIDGGNSKIAGAPNFSLHFIRLFCTIYKRNKRTRTVKKEFYVLVSASGGDLSAEISYDISVFDAKFSFKPISSMDETLMQGKNRAEIDCAANAARKFSEIIFAKEIIDELYKEDIIVLDRDLQATITDEAEYLNELYSKAEEKGVVVCGLAKTNRLFTNTGNSAVAAVEEISPEKEWFYYPIVEIKNPEHRAEMCFVKLHKDSNHIFRFEIYSKQRNEINRVLALLEQNSADPVFLGYPYGLVEADRFARVTNNEIEFLKMEFMTNAGEEFARIKKYLSATDAHEILDNIG